MPFKIGDQVLDVSFEEQGVDAIPGAILDGPKQISFLDDDPGVYQVEFVYPAASPQYPLGPQKRIYDNVQQAGLVADSAEERAASAARAAAYRRQALARAKTVERRAEMTTLRERLAILEAEDERFGVD
jgi:hypothetical protein